MSIDHWVGRHRQPTNFSCCQSALANLLAHYGMDFTPQEIIEQMPVVVDDSGNEFGTLTQHLATWCRTLGFDVTLHTFDTHITDLSWQGLSDADLITRLESVKEVRNFPALGNKMSRLYVQAYVDFIRAGGSLRIKPWLSSDYLRTLVNDGPVHLSLDASVLRDRGRITMEGICKWRFDDIGGSNGTHSVVVKGFNDDGFLLMDSWTDHDDAPVHPEHLLAAFAAASWMADNMIVQLIPTNALKT